MGSACRRSSSAPAPPRRSANPNTAEAALALLVNGRVDLTPLLTHRFPLAEFAAALETFETRKDGAVKVAIKPS